MPQRKTSKHSRVNEKYEGTSVSVRNMFVKRGLEPDQRILDALRMQAPSMGPIDSIPFLYALQRLNARGFDLLPDLASEHVNNAGLGTEIATDDATASSTLDRLIHYAALSRRSPTTLGATDVLRAVADHAKTVPEYLPRWATVDHIVHALGENPQQNLSDLPRVRRLLKVIQQSVDGTDDYQYILSFEGSRIHFRIVSTVDDFVCQNDSGLWVPHRALLTHVGHLGLFTDDSVSELEDLINSAKTKEEEFQKFFERYPNFLRRWDYREVHPHVYLIRPDEGPLIPDFILTDVESQRAALVELKRAGALKSKLIRHQDNRLRFADAMMEARAQLLEYRDWFDIPANRESVSQTVGMEIYRPRMMVIVGRASEFKPGIERAKLADRHPDVELVTYDDILTHAKRRRALIEQPANSRNLPS